MLAALHLLLLSACMEGAIHTSVAKGRVLLAEGVIADAIGFGCVLLKVLVITVYILHGGFTSMTSASQSRHGIGTASERADFQRRTHCCTALGVHLLAAVY